MQLEELLSKAEAIFFRLGIKSVTMDDLAREMGISKKTLYELVESKDDLVFKLMSYYIEDEKNQVCSLNNLPELNPIEQYLHIILHFNGHIRDIKPGFLFDLKKYHPRSWQVFLEYKNGFMYDFQVNNIKLGIQQGLYRNDIQPEIIAKIYINSLDSMLDLFEEMNHEIKLIDLVKMHVIYHLRGIASSEGIKFIENIKISPAI